MVRAATWLSLALAGLLGVANAAEVANTEDTPDERTQQLCSENVPCSDGYYCTLLGHCAPKFLSNAACAFDEQCAGGHCRNLGRFYQYCACFSHDQCNNDMPGRKKYVCTPQNYCSPCKKKGCYPEFRFELGESCSDDNDCQSGNCDANEDGVHVCSCSPVQPCEGGAKCVDDLDCESTTCGDDGRCKCFNHKKRKVRVGCTDEQLCTKSNTCEALKLGGESCGNSKECVGKCKKGVCQCSDKVPCQDYFYCEGKECVPQLDAEETCYYDIECKSGNCENYKCGCVAGEVTCPSGQYCLENGSEEVAGQGLCSEKKDWWQLCGANKECNSRSCEAVGNKKRCKCQVDDDCPNTNRFTCDVTEGTCLVKDDKTCVVNDDPAKNLLSNGVNVRCSSGACVDGVCGLLPGGAACVDEDGNDDNTVCASSACSSGVCECDPSAPGATCEETEFCSTTTSACTPLLLGGESCTVDDECKSGDCDSSSNVCTCTGPGYCAEGQYCSSSGGSCNPAEAYGTPGCTAVGPGFCASGVCAADDTCGCVADDVCSANEFCSMEDNTCQATRVGGEECSEDNQCQAGKCTDDKCECVSSSVYCKAGTYCSNNVCEDDKFGGESCDWDGQCLSGDCTGNMCMCTESSQCEGEDKICSVIGECVDRLVYEEPCIENNDCISGLCDGVCNCVSDDDCAGTAFPLCDSRVVGGETVQGTCVSNNVG